jgi:putative membrane protein
LVSLVGAVALLSACSFGRDDSPARDNGSATKPADDSQKITEADRDFVRALTEAGTAEVKLGELASSRAGTPAVKQFAEMMVKDHSAAGDRLKEIAAAHNADPGSVPVSDEHSTLLAKLSGLKGAAFDREYITAMVDGHEDVLDKLQSRVDEKNKLATAVGKEPKDVNVAPELTDNAFKASLNLWAADTLPVVKGHLERAKAIKDGLGKRTASR